MRISGFLILLLLISIVSCSSGKKVETMQEEEAEIVAPAFNPDSAYSFVARLVEFGPRVPNTAAHRAAGDWLASKLRGYGWEVTEQKATVKAFDGTDLAMRNIFAQFNPDRPERLLLLAHWDCRPWADNDPDPANHGKPVDGANDGASGVGVLLEIARQLSLDPVDKGIDILFVDAEDWGENNDEESWALGTRYFAQNPPKPGYRPYQAILLDMVGAPDASFGYEYFSQRANPGLLEKIVYAGRLLGHDKYFHTGFGGAVTDDHSVLIEYGIPAVDIIDYRDTPGYQGFDPTWHTVDDTLDNISAETLGAVGETILYVIKN